MHLIQLGGTRCVEAFPWRAFSSASSSSSATTDGTIASWVPDLACSLLPSLGFLGFRFFLCLSVVSLRAPEDYLG
jgi:hypothetical protein